MVVCLDENYQTLNQKDPQTLMGLNFLHGGGTKYNTANRWFDKTIQVSFVLSDLLHDFHRHLGHHWT